MKPEIKVQLDKRPGPVLEYKNFEHVPYNRRRWEIKQSTVILKVQDCPSGPQDGEPWIELQLTETTQTNPNGPFQSRTISATLHGADRQALIDMLNH